LRTYEKQLYTIEQVATRTGFTKRALRYYEELGLLQPAGRTEGNYRRYAESDIQRLEQIKEMHELLGFTLTEIRAILGVEDERGHIKAAYKHETDAAAKIAQLDRADELIRSQLHCIQHKLAGLEQMQSALIAKLEYHKQLRNESLDT
jgi:MerR family transcriptional regulator, repressor of the yfmOP operon